MTKMSFETYEGRTYGEALEFLTAHGKEQIHLRGLTKLVRTPDTIDVVFDDRPLIVYHPDGRVVIHAMRGVHHAEAMRQRLNAYAPAAFTWRGGQLRCLFRIDYDAVTKSMNKNFLLRSGHTTPCDAFDGMNVGPIYNGPVCRT